MGSDLCFPIIQSAEVENIGCRRTRSQTVNPLEFLYVKRIRGFAGPCMLQVNSVEFVQTKESRGVEGPCTSNVDHVEIERMKQ